jgi:hypothetical protein
MNIKKQLNKIRNYVEELEILSDKEHEELQQYQLSAYKFVDQKITPTDAREEFKALLGDTTFVGGDFGNTTMEKIINNVWQPIRPTPDEVHCGSNHVQSPTYTELENENARLREQLGIYEKTRSIQAYESLVARIEKLQEQLKWHPVSELPKTEVEKLWTVTVLLINDYEAEPTLAYYSFNSNCWYDYYKAIKVIVTNNSKWCYIPEDKGGE